MGNKFSGEGNLGAYPELNQNGDSDDDAVCNLRIYFDKPVPVDGGGFEDKGGFWMDVEIWGKRGIACANLLKKGNRVAVEGYLIGKNWKDRETGDDRTRIVLRAKRVNPDMMIVEGIKDKKESEASA